MWMSNYTVSGDDQSYIVGCNDLSIRRLPPCCDYYEKDLRGVLRTNDALRGLGVDWRCKALPFHLNAVKLLEQKSILMVDDSPYEIARVLPYFFYAQLSTAHWFDWSLVNPNEPLRPSERIALLQRMALEDVVLLDLDLGCESGSRLCSELKDHRPRGIVIGFSGSGMAPREFKKAGAAGCVYKGQAPNVCVDEIASIVRAIG